MDERSSPAESKDRAAQARGEEVGERLPQRKPEDLEDKGSKEDKSASTTMRSTPFFHGTSHKELRALINARDNHDVWAAMLEVEHPAQDWWDAYQVLQQNQDPKQSVLMMLIYQQNLHWLNLRQISGLAYKVRFSSCQEQYEELPSAESDAFADMPAGILWPKLIICSANNDDLDHNFALTVVQELSASFDASMAFVCCAPDSGLPRDKAASGQNGFLEELFCRTDLAYHAGHGCGGTHESMRGGIVVPRCQYLPRRSVERIPAVWRCTNALGTRSALAFKRGDTGDIEHQRPIAQINCSCFEGCSQGEEFSVGHLRQLHFSSRRRDFECGSFC